MHRNLAELIGRIKHNFHPKETLKQITGYRLMAASAVFAMLGITASELSTQPEACTSVIAIIGVIGTLTGAMQQANNPIEPNKPPRKSS